MASSLEKSNKMKRMVSKKSHSWWWDSHISPKNSKWLQENLEEMDRSVKRMLKLIEEDGDSFAKKAEMYYQKRPELINLVEEFYRMYRSLAERYDNVTGELRKNIPLDLQSQGSGVSDVGSETTTAWPSPDQRLTRHKLGPRAAGFDFFLGSGGISSDFSKEGDESSTLDSGSESDDSSINNYSVISANGHDQGLRKRIFELEVELRDMKERLRMQQEEISDVSFNGTKNGNSEDLLARIAGYGEELRAANEKILQSEEEIARLKMKLQKYESSESTNHLHVGVGLMYVAQKNIESKEANLEEKENAVPETQERVHGLEAEVSGSESELRNLKEELKITKEKLDGTEKEVAGLRRELENSASSVRCLQDQLGSAQKDVATWKGKVERKEKEILKLQDRIERYKSNLSDRNQEIRLLRETISNANESLSEENSQIRAELTRLSKEHAYLQDNLKEWELRCQSSEEELRRVRAGKTEMEGLLGTEIEKLRAGITERSDQIEKLKNGLDDLHLRYGALISETDKLHAELSSKDDRIHQMDKHLHQLQMEHVELVAGAETARKLVEELRSKVEELEKDVERQREVILEGAEEKREAIRQLCFSLEHYRSGYQQLRQALTGHRRLPVMAS